MLLVVFRRVQIYSKILSTGYGKYYARNSYLISLLLVDLHMISTFNNYVIIL